MIVIWITLIRIVIWLTFFLLIVEGVAVMIFASKFYAIYVRKHRILEVRIEAIERRLDAMKEPHP